MEPVVSAVLLAAGTSSRMGRTKQLLPLGSKTVIRHCLDPLVAAGITDIAVVINPRSGGIAEALHGMPVTVAVNDALSSEMAESIRAGLRSLKCASSGILVCLSDHPLVRARTITALIGEHRGNPGSIIIPAYLGRRGHPTLFPVKIIHEIFSGVTLRDIIRKDAARVRTAAVDDEGTILDMDTEEDYRAMVDKIERK